VGLGVRRSWRIRPRWTRSAFADDLDAVRQHFGLERVTLVGQSWGAGIAALYAMRYPGPGVSRMVLIGPMPLRRAASLIALSLKSERADRRKNANDSSRRATLFVPIRGMPTRAGVLRPLVPPVFCRSGRHDEGSGRLLCRFAGSAAQRRARRRRHTMASLGDFDGETHSSASARRAGPARKPGPDSSQRRQGVAAAFPNARLLLLEGVGHFPYVETPEAFFPAVDAFLAGECRKKREAWDHDASLAGFNH